MTYTAPIADILLSLNHGAGLKAAVEAGHYGDFDGDITAAVLEEAGKFASDVLAPLNSVGDEHGVKLDNGVVTTAPGWPDAYRQWTAAGWNAVSGPEEFGGQGLPLALNAACTEIWSASNLAFGLCPLLTLGAIEALDAHGSDELKSIYLAKMVSGEWTGTMQLTEPGAGSDVGALRTRAERADDGSYRLKGSKIFITYGEHDMTDNIVHFVLARLPDAPAGTRGISLFLVPKFLVNADGSLGARNDIHASGVEHKLGIHASPTCTMTMGDKGGATGFLIGAPCHPPSVHRPTGACAPTGHAGRSCDRPRVRGLATWWCSVWVRWVRPAADRPGAPGFPHRSSGKPSTDAGREGPRRTTGVCPRRTRGSRAPAALPRGEPCTLSTRPSSTSTSPGTATPSRCTCAASSTPTPRGPSTRPSSSMATCSTAS